MNTTRRRLLQGGAGLLILPSARTAFGYQANERLRLGIVGHIYNASHFFTSVHIYPGVEIAALCDPEHGKIPEIFRAWEERVRKANAGDRAAGPYRRLLEDRPPRFSDPRKMLDAVGDRLDGLVVSVYDHQHAGICGPAIRQGKHVFSERPLGVTVREARALRELAARHKVATSIRNPGNSYGPFRRGLELIREGAIGPVREVHVWFFRGGPDRREPPQGSPPVPEGLDWDAWLGPAAARPYHPDWMTYSQWRELCGGGLGTFGPHAANLAFMALRVQELWKAQPEGARQTLRISAKPERINTLSFPRWEQVRWEVPARGDLPPVTFHWHHGPEKAFAPGSRESIVEKMRERGATQERAESLLRDAGALIIGSEGAIATDSHNAVITLLPEEKFRGVPQDRPRAVASSRGHYMDWILACRGGEPPWANFEYADALSEFLMLGNVATQFEGELEYDPIGCRILNHPEADRKLTRTYRKGWSL